MEEKSFVPQAAPLVSICCITYNHEKYIHDCLEGFLKQRTDFPIEIIIHDDASTDNTAKIIQEYANKHKDLFVTIFQTENQYSKKIKPFIKYVFPKARGKYIAMCEGDDYWTDPYKLKKQVDFLEGNPEYVACYHDAMIVDENGNVLQKSKLPENYKHDFSREEILKGAWILTLSNCFRNVVQDIPEELNRVHNGDTFLNSFLGNYGKGKYMAEVKPAVYRAHSNSIWSSLEESEKMLHGGATRTWMYRYYKKAGQIDVANHFKDLAVFHFTRGLDLARKTDRNRHESFSRKIVAEYYDILEGLPDCELHGLLSDTKNSTVKQKDDDFMDSDQKIGKVLFVNHSIFPLEVSGTPLSTRNHAIGMSKRGWEVAVLIPSAELEEGYRKELSPDGYALYRVPAMDKFEAYFAAPGEARTAELRQTIGRILEDFRPQLVQVNDYVFLPAEILEIFSRSGCIVVREVCNCEELCHLDYPVIPNGLYGRSCSGPENPLKCAKCFASRADAGASERLSRETFDSILEKTERRFDSIRRLYRDVVDQVIFTSPPFRDYYTRFVPVPAEKVRVIPRGFDFPFAGKPDRKKEPGDAVRFAVVGNVVFNKGVGVALEAFEKAFDGNNFAFHVYGQALNPEYRGRLKNLESRYPGRFLHHGTFGERDLPAIASHVDVCIVPSYFDSYNRVLREFLYLGVPVLATDFFGAYIVEDGVNGYRVPVGDADALAERMTDLVSRPERIGELARGAARTRIPTLEEEIDAMAESYGKLLSRPEEKRRAEPREKSPAAKREEPPEGKSFRAVAFYLPQFHPIPENDLWWGKGFTEWTNVAKSRPLFPKHPQPHVPADLGFYDLRLPEVRKAQADLARKYGIEGFCYWHYWFNGRRLLERPFESVLHSGKPDFPFCLAWANETWSRRWLGEERSILMKQVYSREDDYNHALWLVDAFRDRRYLRVDGRPLFLVYRPMDLPDARQTVNVLRRVCLHEGLTDPYLVGINSHCTEADLRTLGFDETLYFMPQLSFLPGCMDDEPSESKRRRNAASGVDSDLLKIYDYDQAMDAMLEGVKKIRHPVIPSLFVGWDNTPRRGENGIVIANESPGKFGRALQSLVDSVQGKPAQRRFVFLNAWNEWAEGNHLEPDTRNGHAFLEEVRKVKYSGRSRKTDATEPVQVRPAAVREMSPVRAIAFYLPQFHPIPENDRWWGKGFTEWANVAKANPLFPGHYQPHLPTDLGFYDLRLPEVRKAQADLAREHGIHGFCYYHYWFNGRTLLDLPLRKVLESGEPDFPFCLCWANENWTRGWDGRDSDLLMEQKYGPEDDLEHIRYLSRIFNDPRYIRIDGKPLYLVYRAGNLPDPAKTASLWREEARRSGLGDLFLCRVERFPEDMTDPRPLGFDAAVEFQPDGVNLGKPLQDPKYAGHAVYRYKDMIRAALSKREPAHLRFPCVCPGWDNSPRRRKNSVVFRRPNPRFYEYWLEETARKAAARRPEERIVFINAFNEWGEGCHLEPDRRFGKSFLEATRRVLIRSGDGAAVPRDDAPRSTRAVSSAEAESVPRVSIVLPVHDRVERTRRCLEALVEYTPGELYEVIVVDDASTDGTKELLSCLGGDVTILSNASRLGTPKACNQGIARAKGKHILLLDNDAVATEGWLEKLLSHLEQHPDVGMVGPMSNGAPGPQQVREVPYGGDMEDMQEFACDFAAGASGALSVTMGLGGFCLLVRKELTDLLGALDESFAAGNFCFDDLCLRAHVAGYLNVVAGDVFVHHDVEAGSGGNGADPPAVLKEDLRRFTDKWRGLVEIDGKGCRIVMTGEHRVRKLLDWGEERFSLKDYRTAMKIFLRVLRFDSANSEALNNLGVIQWQLGDTVTAMNTFQNSLAINPGDADALGNLFRAAAETGRFDLLKPELLETLKEAHPANPDVARLIEGQPVR